MELTFEESHKRWEARRRKLAPQRLLDALKEAETVANDPNAPTCTDLSKLEEFTTIPQGYDRVSQFVV